MPLVPKAQTSNNNAAGLYDESDFVYPEAVDADHCPAEERAIHRMTVVENGITPHKHWSLAQGNTAPRPGRCATGRPHRDGDLRLS